MRPGYLPCRAQFEAIKRSRAKDDGRLARRLGVPLDVVAAARRLDSFRATVEDLFPVGTRVRLDAALDGEFTSAPQVGEFGAANGSDAVGKLFVRWDGGSHLALMPRDGFSVE